MLADHSREEVLAASGLCALQMWNAISGDEPVFAGFINGEVVCAYGAKAGTILGDQAVLWMLVTKHANEHPFLFIRHSRIILAEMRKKHHIIKCFVNVNYRSHAKWMRLLGFESHAILKTALGDFCEYRLGRADG